MMKFRDTMGDIDLHGKWHTNQLQEDGHLFVAGPWMDADSDDLGLATNNIYLFLEIVDQPRWTAELKIVCPNMVPLEERLRAADSCGGDGTSLSGPDMAEALVRYGTHGLVWTESSNNCHWLVRRSLQQARIVIADPFKALQRVVNRIGSTAYETMTGQLLTALVVPRTADGELMKRIYEKCPTLLSGEPSPLYKPSGE